jgi:CBS domain-containing protein
MTRNYAANYRKDRLEAGKPTSEVESNVNIAQREGSEPPEASDPAVDFGAPYAYLKTITYSGGDYVYPRGVEVAPVAESLNSPVGSLGLVETSIVPPMDPVARISSIPAANRGVMSVLLTDSIATAATCMMFEGYSQLAIMQGEREVRGMISWESIAKRSLSSPAPKLVSDCRVDAQVIDADGSLFDALPTIEKFGYVLVRSKERKITGIVTATDLSAELGRLSYAFMSIRTIEVLVRTKLHPYIVAEDLESLEVHSRARLESDPALLTFGENVSLLERPEIWSRLSVNLDKKEFIKRLLEVRDIRNDVMHFDPDPLSPTQRRSLEQMEEFLRQVFV